MGKMCNTVKNSLELKLICTWKMSYILYNHPNLHTNEPSTGTHNQFQFSDQARLRSRFVNILNTLFILSRVFLETVS